MASQAKITSFYRPTKANNSTAAAKRRKAVIENPESILQPFHGFSETTTETTTPTLPVKLEPINNISFGGVDLPKSELASIFTEVGKSVQKKPSVRKPRKTTKLSEGKKILSSKSIQAVERVTEETTSIKDNHDYNPAEVSTPKAAGEATTSVRKRKMQCIEEKASLITHTPPKVEKREQFKTPTKVKKRLEMGCRDPVTNSQTEAVKLQETCIPISPSKQVQFLRLGTLSPRKPEMVSPLRPQASPSKLISKSPACKSLASLLDKVPTSSKLSAEEVKTRLGKNKNLAELQAKLSKVNNCSAQVKEFYANQVQLKKFSSVEFNLDIPISPSKHQSPVKKGTPLSTRCPAFERFHALAQPPSAHLTLPYKYKVLNEAFRCLETVVAMLYNRKECIYFNKLKPAVQKMLQREFTEKHLAQVSHVFPSAYKITYEQLAANLQCSPVKTRGFQLMLTPQLNFLSSESLNGGEKPLDASEDCKVFQPLGPTMLVERRYVFHNRLINIVKQHHTEFLAEYNPMLNVPEESVTRWHQNFDVDSVPDVPAADLPLPPQIKTFVTAKDVLAQANNIAKINPRLEAALKERASLREDQPKPEAEPEPKKPEAPVNAGLKGVSQSLIDKIRAREAAKSQKQMTMNTEEIRRQGMSKMLPELARIINSIFVTEKKSVLPLKQLIEKIQYSHRGIMSASSVEEHIRLIRTVYPEWLDVLSRGNIDYVKVDRKIDSNIVYQKMEDSSKS